MAYAPFRSCVSALHAGMTDGAYKKYASNRGGWVEGVSIGYRVRMSGLWHGFNEIQEKMMPDGRLDRPPYYGNVTPEDDENV